jgi:hypothetical protein
MTVSDAQLVTTDRPGRGYIIGSAIIAVMLTILSVLTIQHRSDDSTAYVIGQFTGALIAPVLIGAVIYWVARWATRGNRAKSFKIMFWGLVVWFIVMLASFIGIITSPAFLSRYSITPADKEGLTVSSDSIRNKKLGFALPNPGDSFVRYEEAEEVLMHQFGHGRDMAVWVFRDSTRGMGLGIQVEALGSLDERGFRAYARAMRPKAFATVFSDTLTWAGNHREYTLGLHHDNGVLSITRCVPRLNKVRKLVVCVQMIGSDSANLAKVPNGLTVND